MDLNADVGEGCATDAALIPLLTSANIGLAAHAGSEAITRLTIARCREFGVACGAHPSYPDREHFGRRSLPMSLAELLDSLSQQLMLFKKLTAEQGVGIHHIKCHGALYNDCVQQPKLAAEVAALCEQILPQVPLMTMPFGALAVTLQQHGRRFIAEGFADRAYAAASQLTSRQQPGAVLGPMQAIAQGLALANNLPISTGTTTTLLPIQSICVHGDTPSALIIAKQIRQQLLADGVCLKPPHWNDAS